MIDSLQSFAMSEDPIPQVCGDSDPIFVLNTSKCFELRRELISGATANDPVFGTRDLKREVYGIEEGGWAENRKVISCVEDKTPAA